MNAGFVSFINGAGKGLTCEAAVCQLKDRVLYVDCGNQFDPHQYYRRTKSDKSLEETLVVRPFTLYQLKSFVLEKLEKVIQESKVKYVLVSGIEYYRFDDEQEASEYKTIIERVLGHFRRLAGDYQIHVIVDLGGAVGG
jgi:hypothetical protein